MLARRVLSSSLHRARTTPLVFRTLSSSSAAAAATSAKPSESIVFMSPHGFIDIPNVTIWEIAQDQAAKNGDANAFICGLTHQKITYEELCEDAKRLAVALAQDGVRKGDVSGFIMCLYVWLLGCVLTVFVLCVCVHLNRL